MYKLALVGKNISHSLSPKVYKELLNGNVHYSLLDFNDASEIPRALDLLKKLDGFSITSPYKQHFLKEVILIGIAEKLNAINCVRLKNNIAEGCNTDYLAILEILKREAPNFELVIILGDGVMSRVTQMALSELGISYQIISRKLDKNFQHLNLTKIVNDKNALFINTCAREFVYSGELNKNITFWDYNYNFAAHKLFFNNKCTYVDGEEMLILQAKYALEFWSIN